MSVGFVFMCLAPADEDLWQGQLRYQRKLNFRLRYLFLAQCILKAPQPVEHTRLLAKVTFNRKRLRLRFAIASKLPDHIPEKVCGGLTSFVSLLHHCSEEHTIMWVLHCDLESVSPAFSHDGSGLIPSNHRFGCGTGRLASVALTAVCLPWLRSACTGRARVLESEVQDPFAMELDLQLSCVVIEMQSKILLQQHEFGSE